MVDPDGDAERLEAEHVPVVTILPPVAPRVAAAMADTRKYAYLAELRSRFAALPLAFDMMDWRLYGLTDCQFIEDGFHATTTGWARIIRAVAGLPSARSRAAFRRGQSGPADPRL